MTNDFGRVGNGLDVGETTGYRSIPSGPNFGKYCRDFMIGLRQALFLLSAMHFSLS